LKFCSLIKGWSLIQIQHARISFICLNLLDLIESGKIGLILAQQAKLCLLCIKLIFMLEVLSLILNYLGNHPFLLFCGELVALLLESPLQLLGLTGRLFEAVSVLIELTWLEDWKSCLLSFN
jgi:hypothetical protein